MDGVIIDSAKSLGPEHQWQSHFLPALVAMHVGVILIALQLIDDYWVLDVAGFLVFVAGFAACINQADPATYTEQNKSMRFDWIRQTYFLTVLFLGSLLLVFLGFWVVLVYAGLAVSIAALVALIMTSIGAVFLRRMTKHR